MFKKISTKFFRGEKGFSLIEILVVVIIIGIIAAISIPILMRSRMTGNEVSAIGGLKVIADGQTDYYNASQPHTFSTNLTNLATGKGAGNVAFLAEDVGSGIKTGYTFYITPGTPSSNGTYLSWRASAWPLTYHGSGVRSFYIDQSGIIKASDMGGLPGDPLMPPLD